MCVSAHSYSIAPSSLSKSASETDDPQFNEKAPRHVRERSFAKSQGKAQMTSMKLQNGAQNFAQRGAKLLDVRALIERSQLVLEKEAPEHEEFGGWSPAKEMMLRLDIFEFLQNLEAQHPRIRVFH